MFLRLRSAIKSFLTDTPLASMYLSSEVKIQSNAEYHALNQIGSTENIDEMTTFFCLINQYRCQNIYFPLMVRYQV